MALTVKQIVNRHGAFVSAVTAALVGATIVIISMLQLLINLLVTLGQGMAGMYDLGPALPQIIGNTLLFAVPFAAGFFVSLWIIAPIAEELRIPHVVTRAVLATGVASTVYFIVLAVVGVIGSFAINGSLYSQPLPSVLGFSGSEAVSALVRALVSALNAFVTTLPLGVLAGVMLWLWRKDHPPRHPLSGLIDEV